MPDLFFIVEEIMLYLRSLEKNLKLNKLDLDKKSFWTKKNKKKIEDLLIRFNLLIDTNFDNPRVIGLIKEVKGLELFLEKLKKSYNDDPTRAEVLLPPVVVIAKINSEIDNIKNFIQSWERLIEDKVSFIEKSNKHLKKLPIHSNEEMFYVMVKELNQANLITKHGLHPTQAKSVSELSNSQLIDYNIKDPLSGRRSWKKTDIFSYPGSVITVTQGHHRIYEIYRRYLLDKIDGDKLIEFMKDEN